MSSAIDPRWTGLRERMTQGEPVAGLRRRYVRRVDVAVPKRRMSRSNTRSRRAQWKTTAPALVRCPQCRDPKLPHTACPTCGTYNRRQVITPS